MYFLETLQVRAPCHGGVLYSFYIDGIMLFEFFMNFLNIEKNKNFKKFYFQNFMFSSRFMIFPTFKKNWCKNNSGVEGRVEKYIFF